MDCRGITDEDLDYMMHWLRNEGNEALINHLKEESFLTPQMQKMKNHAA